MLLHSIVYACRCARVQAEFEACDDDDLAPLDTEHAGDETDLGLRVDRTRARVEQDRTDLDGQVEHLGDRGVVGEVDRLPGGERGGERFDRVDRGPLGARQGAQHPADILTHETHASLAQW